MEPSPARAGRRVTCCAKTVDSLQSSRTDGQTVRIIIRPASAAVHGSSVNDVQQLLTVDTCLV